MNVNKTYPAIWNMSQTVSDKSNEPEDGFIFGDPPQYLPLPINTIDELYKAEEEYKNQIQTREALMNVLRTTKITQIAASVEKMINELQQKMKYTPHDRTTKSYAKLYKEWRTGGRTRSSGWNWEPAGWINPDSDIEQSESYNWSWEKLTATR